MKIKLFFLSVFFCSALFASKIEIMNPPHWWIGMKYNKIEVLLKGENISNYNFSLIHEDKAKLVDVFKFQNPNYVVLSLDVSKVKKAKTLQFSYSTSFHNYFEFDFELKERKQGVGKQGIDASDFIYLIFPDRFVNGNPQNDLEGKMRDPLPSTHFVGRRGGDLEGVISKLDYIKDLGVTATWLCPVEENNTKLRSYHGYGFTSHYEVDRRFGGNEVYKQYVEESHKKDLKVVKDVVFNHCNEAYFLWEDKIDDSWFNPKKLTNYRVPALLDHYASSYDKDLVSNGWFVAEMPDFNQKNPRVANFLTQYALWWIEEFDVDAYRMDTFAYPDNEFIWKMMQTVKEEYPNFFLFGEVWDSQEAILSWFDIDRNNKNKSCDSKKSCKKKKSETPKFNIGLTDFEFQYAMMDLAKEDFGWNTGLLKLYYTLVQDYVYKDAFDNVTFLGNHDVDRFYTSIKEDFESFKLATTILLTSRGIPQWYYADEVLATNEKDPELEGFKGDDALRRICFPGGFPNDTVDKFTPQGRNQQENEFVNFLSTLANYRKNSKAITKGKLTHFVPQDNVYVYFRYIENEKVMVIINRNEKEQTLDLSRFRELLPVNSDGKNILTGENIRFYNELKLKPKTPYVFEIK
ncbi:MAG: cyclomaltodextrinase C-terminal domain-containing protein [Flavobacteriales bacterium]|nr:cyclomaltodextrinase C-terminal domain-containing protein [Flavobacteriales bacterium]